jgi:hypothetical protein
MRVRRFSCRYALLFIFLSYATSLLNAPAQENAGVSNKPDRPEVNVKRAKTAPVIDGNLDDEAWKDAKLESYEWISYAPLRGDKVRQKN